MTRLTKKISGFVPNNAQNYRNSENITHNEIVNKLGQLEDIEEELGIDLKVYHRLMEMLYCGEPENNVYIKEGNNIIEVHILEIDYCKKKIIFYKNNWEDEDDEYVYGFYQYGEQWALSKEELEK